MKPAAMPAELEESRSIAGATVFVYLGALARTNCEEAEPTWQSVPLEASEYCKGIEQVYGLPQPVCAPASQGQACEICAFTPPLRRRDGSQPSGR